MCPVAAASTMTRSKSARPSIASRTSHTILPIVRISFTPGAAVATKSRTRASGPMRPMTGTRRLRRRYSCSEASVSIAIASTPGWISRGLNPTGACSNCAGTSPFGSTSTSRTRLPMLDASSAVAAAIVLLPTPPFPVKKSSRRSRSAGAGPVTATCALARAEADLAATGVGRDHDVGDLVDRHADASPLRVGEPQERVALGHRALDGGGHDIDRIVGLDGELASCVDHADAYFHALDPSRQTILSWVR